MGDGNKTDTILHILLYRKEIFDIHNINYGVLLNKMRLYEQKRLFVIVRCSAQSFWVLEVHRSSVRNATPLEIESQ
jgi:hypothetical protein